MGKASRNKKRLNAERSEQKSPLPAPPSGGALLKSPQGRLRIVAASPPSPFGEGLLIVIDANGVLHGEKASRRAYWNEVCEGIRERGVECLPEMADRGSSMRLSVLDVKIPMVDLNSGEENQEDIFSAMFLLERVDCFQWLLSEARRRGCNWAVLGQVFRNLVWHSQHLNDEEPRMAMATMMARLMVEKFHIEGRLTEAMGDNQSTMGQPFARRIAEDYLAELRANAERAEMEALVAREGRADGTGGRRI